MFFIIWILFSIGVGVLASNRGRNGLWWTFVSLVGSPLLALIVLIFIPDLTAQETQMIQVQNEYSRRIEENKAQEEANILESKKILSSEYAASFDKLDNLVKNQILTNDEFAERKAKQINDLKLKIIEEDPDMFLSGLIPIYKKNVITNTELQQIKSIVYNQSDI